MPLRDPERPEDITPEQARLLGYLEQSLRAQFLFRRNKDYLVQAGKVVIVDEFTGRLMPGRRWSDGLHQAVEAKEGVKVEPENVTYATITLQNYFRMYEKLAGMTGTALTEAEEFYKIYKLDVLPIPTNLEYTAALYQRGALERRRDGRLQISYYATPGGPDHKFRCTGARISRMWFTALKKPRLRAISWNSPLLRHRPPALGGHNLCGAFRGSLRRLSAEPIRRLLQTVLLRETWLKDIRPCGERAIPNLSS